MTEQSGKSPGTEPELYNMLSALRDCWQSSLKRSDWQIECNLNDIAEGVGLDVVRAARLFVGGLRKSTDLPSVLVLNY